MEDMDYGNLVVSIKSSDVTMNYKAHKILSAATDVPVHIGITEAGTPAMGKVKSAIGLGALLLEGIGDTMRVSLTADPVEEVKFAIDILKARPEKIGHKPCIVPDMRQDKDRPPVPCRTDRGQAGSHPEAD